MNEAVDRQTQGSDPASDAETSQRAPGSSTHASTGEPRIQVVCHGVAAHAQERATLHDVPLALLRSKASAVDLAVVRLERAPDQRSRGVYGCQVELFSRGLEHVPGYAEHTDLTEAVTQATLRAIRALETPERFDPWTSAPPSSRAPGSGGSNTR